jgi:YcxB-like protein
MTLTYNLDKEDYLNHQLFIASISDRIKKQRRRSRIVWSIAFLSMAWLFYQKRDNFLAYYFLAFGILYMLFYPYYSKWFYRRHYKRSVTETFKNRFDKLSTVTIDDKYIHDVTDSGETKISISQIEKIYDTGDYFFLRLGPGDTLIIPKLKISNADLVKKELKEIAAKLNVDLIEMKDWRWK